MTDDFGEPRDDAPSATRRTASGRRPRRTEKIAVSLPSQQVSAARAAVAAGSAASVSAYVSRAIAGQERDDSLAAIVADLIAEDGVPNQEDYDWADRVLRASP